MSARRPFSRLWALSTSVCVMAALGGAGLAQQPVGEPAAPSLPVPPPPGDLPAVSTPEDAPNPVRERREQQAIEDNSGIDPELGAIAEPDADPVGPALRITGDGEWQRPDEDIRRKAREDAMARAAEIQRKAAGERSVGDGLIMPRLMAPNIPIVPLDLLFPPDVQAAGPVPVREARGSAVVFGALDRETGKTSLVRVPVGRSMTFGALQVAVEGCFMSHPDDSFEAWAFVDVVDKGRPRTQQLAVLPQRERARLRNAVGERSLRKGWIIASSPAVTPIDHPTYDVWLVRCEGDGGGGPLVRMPEGTQPPAAGQATSPADQSVRPDQGPAPATSATTP